MSRYRKNNEGGHGNPPIKDQFKPGNPGGPGRPPGSLSIEAALRKTFGGNVPYLENGKPKKSSATEALSKRALQLGLSGPPRANAAALELAAKYGPKEPGAAEPEFSLEQLSMEELELYGRLASKLAGVPFVPIVNDHPLAYLSDPDDPRNSYEERTVEGVHYRHSRCTNVPSQLVGIDNRGYWSAALPRRPGCLRGTTVVGDDE